MDADVCGMAGCTADPVVARRHTASGEVYGYCEAHDPLDDDDVAAMWAEVAADG